MNSPLQGTNFAPPADGAFSARETRALLAALGHSPRHPLGQNFLVDGNIVAKSLRAAGVTTGDTVVEIGPGLGTLTAALLAAGANVYAVERDPVLADHLRRWLLPRHSEKFHLVEGDAVALPLAGLPAARAGGGTGTGGTGGGDFKVVANLPYAISTPWLDAVLASPALPSEMLVMLQRETADRFRARSDADGGDGSFVGAITVALDAAYERRSAGAVPAACFFPPPKVESALLHLRRRATPRRLAPETRRVLREIFVHRRKQLGGILRRLPAASAPPVAAALAAWTPTLERWGASARSRPGEVAFAAWLALDDAITEAAK
ncbi:MAG: ribosomal RNA small subunit methyltransferase A [Puniceicoccales bacterium]|jgi:16S rRNA (adenine1518-N6/adenine1519-N6)-dimethyltransferase|nr:ribosomal RNA small subunit methyltransferase A [Puniceicoccales bacterium]